MAKQKKVNKNLVAFLTVMGILLSVSLVVVVVFQGSQRDPVKVAEQAKQAADGGDMDRAIEFYLRAYEASRKKDAPNVAYYIEASKCAYSKGDVSLSLTLLNKANTQAPTDKTVLTALLERYWELGKLGAPVQKDAGRFAEKMIALVPNDVLALITSSNSIRRTDPDDTTKQALADERLQKAAEIAPSDPRVVISRAERIMQNAAAIIAKAHGKPTREDEAKVKALKAEALTIVDAGVKKNADNADLVTDYAQMLVGEERLDDALAALDAGVTAAPSNAEMHASLGRFLRAYTLYKAAKNEPLTPEKRKETLTRAFAESTKARELDPGLYAAYEDLAQASLLDADPTADPAADGARRYKAAIAIYEDGIKSTLNTKTIRALTAQQGRLQLLVLAFNCAREFSFNASDDESRKWATDKARKFAADLKTQFPEDPVSSLKQAELALIDRDDRRAIQHYLAAETASKNSNFDVNRQANLQLALRYYAIGETGTARKHADAAYKLYGSWEQAPLELGVIMGDMLIRERKFQEALDLCDKVAANPVYFKDNRLKRIRVAALTELDRKDEARALAGTGDAADVDDQLLRARVAVGDGDFNKAAELFKAAAEAAPERPDILRSYSILMMRTDRRDEAVQFLQSLRPKIKQDEAARTCEGLLIVLASNTPEERQAKLLEAIEKIPDVATRTQELYVYYSNLGKDDKASEALDALEKLKPDDRSVLESQFLLALHRKQYDRAAQYVTRLTALNADGAGGARFRAQLNLSRNDAEGAVRELRSALQKFPGDSGLLTMLAVAQSGKPEEAIGTLREALDSNPRNLQALKMMHEMQVKIGEQDAALEYLKRARLIAPADPYVQKFAQAMDEDERPAEGIERREGLRKDKPQDVENLLRLCQLYLKVGNRERADDALQAAGALAPGSIEVVRLAVQIYNNRADRAKAEKVFRSYIESQTESNKIYGKILLARYYFVLGDTDEGRKQLLDLPKMCETEISDPRERHAWQIEVTRELANRYYDLANVEGRQADPAMIDSAINTIRQAIAMFTPEDSAETKSATRSRLLEYMVRKPELHGDLAKELESFLKDYPNDYRGLGTRVQLQIAQGKFNEARDTLNTMLQLNPKDALSLSTRGLVNSRLRLYDQAVQDLESAKAFTQPEPGQPLSKLGQVVRVRLANLYEQNDQKIEQAIAAHREIVDGPPINRVAAANLIRLYRLYRKPEEAEKLIADYEQKPGEPQQPFWPMQLGTLQLERGAYAAAAQQFQRAFDLSGAGGARKDSVALSSLLFAKTKAGAAPEAVRIFEGQPQESIEPRVRVAAAWAYDGVKDSAKSQAQLEQAIIDGAGAGLPQLISVAQLIAENRPWPEVATLCKKVAAGPGAASKELNARLLTVQALALINSPETALGVPDVLKPIIDQSQPGSEEWIRASLITAQGYMVAGKKAEATAAYENVLKHSTNNVEALNNLAFFKAEEGQLAEAEKYADKLATIESDDANIADTIGYVYNRKGRKAESESWFREALRLDPRNVNARIHLAELLAAGGKADEAKAVLERAAADADKQKDVENAKKARDLLSKLGK